MRPKQFKISFVSLLFFFTWLWYKSKNMCRLYVLHKLDGKQHHGHKRYPRSISLRLKGVLTDYKHLNFLKNFEALSGMHMWRSTCHGMKWYWFNLPVCLAKNETVNPFSPLRCELKFSARNFPWSSITKYFWSADIGPPVNSARWFLLLSKLSEELELLKFQ